MELSALPRYAQRTLLLSPLRGDPNTPIIALIFLVPVGLSTSLGGLTLGIVASLLAFLVFNFFFITPYYTLLVHHTQDLLMLVVFLVVAVTVSQLVGRVQASLAAAQARERETTSLYELSAALTGLRSEAAIAQTVGERLIEIAQARAVEIVFQGGPGAVARTFLLPSGAAHPDTPPWAVLPLLTAGGRFGEIRLWRPGTGPEPGEQRLLATFASQGALALEHALLSHAETQTRILEESDRLKTALLSSVSHELRTPLATMKAAITSLHSGEVEWAAPARGECWQW